MIDTPSIASSLWDAIRASGTLTERFLADASGCFSVAELLERSVLYGRGHELQGRSVLLATETQLTTAAALVELDGVARRVVLCPPGLPEEHLTYVTEAAGIDGIISDRTVKFNSGRCLHFSPCSRTPVPGMRRGGATFATEWVLLTSGTTGLPKLVAHTLNSLCAAIRTRSGAAPAMTWSTFYDIRRYGGLQIFLRAMLAGGSLVLSSHQEPVADFLQRAGSRGVSHISGTPSHWRRALMSPAIEHLQPKYIRLSGEAVDQPILNRLRSTYPQARIVHAFASTEAGVAFEVVDALAGFPREILERTTGPELRIKGETLRIRSAGAADRYLGENAPRIKDEEGFVDTHDLVELRGDRFFFAGRGDGVINVGGLKVHPEEVESVIGRHPDVQMCLVRAKKSPITGAIIVADVVLRTAPPARSSSAGTEHDILQLCRETLPSHKVPAAINIVPTLLISESGKVMRRNA